MADPSGRPWPHLRVPVQEANLELYRVDEARLVAKFDARRQAGLVSRLFNMTEHRLRGGLECPGPVVCTLPPMNEAAADPGKRSITSEGLSPRAVFACWAVAAVLMVSGITATFVAGTGAAPASMILFGSLFFVLALMKRVPLSLEVGGAKFDASYDPAAFDAGREVGLQQGVEVALSDVEKAEESGESAHAALERRRESWHTLTPWGPESETLVPSGTVGYRGPIACAVAGITYRQLDYWARTGLVDPSGEGARSGMRLYTANDIVLLKVIKRLLDAGIALSQVRSAVHRLREMGAAAWDAVTLMSDGQTLYETTSPDEVFDLLRSGHGYFGIAVDKVRQEVLRTLLELPAE